MHDRQTNIRRAFIRSFFEFRVNSSSSSSLLTKIQKIQNMMYHCSQLAIAIRGEQWLDTKQNNYSNNTIKILSRINCYRTTSIYLFMDNFSHLKIIYFALLINGIQGRTRYHQNKSQRCQGRFSSKDNKLLREG